MASCLRKTRTVLSMVKALVCRGMFTLHALICIWRVTVIKGAILYWSLAGTLPLVILETVYTLCKKKGGEWKWICPSVFLYLGTSVPAIWFLELDVMNQRVAAITTLRPEVFNTSKEILLLNGQMPFAISLGSQEWCKILEQLLLLILIVGRWLLPKGEITREQLSQLLLVYIGMAADIIELFEAFKEDTVRGNRLLTITILSLWTASLTQFTLVVTATKSKKTRTSALFKENGASASCNNGTKGCCPTEVLSILLSVFLQDAPFLVLRMLLIFRYDVLSYSNIFFTCKNSLVLMLQIYRLVVLFTDSPKSSSSKTKINGTKVVMRRSSGSDSMSMSSDCLSDFSFSENPNDGYSKHRKYHRRQRSLIRQARIDAFKGNSASSLETDLNDSMPGSSKLKRKAILAAASVHHDSDSSSLRHGKSKGIKGLKTSTGSNGKNRDQQMIRGISFYSGDEEETELKSKRKLKEAKRNVDYGSVDRGQSQRRRQRQSSVDLERRGRRSRSPSPILPPPPDSMNASDLSDAGNMSYMDREGPSHQGGKRASGQKDSPKSSPHRARQADYKTIKRHHQDHHEDGSKLQDKNSKSPRSKPRQHWSSIKDLRSVLTLLDETGKYHTVVLKNAADDGTPGYVIDKDEHRQDISV